jgi:DNA polymerase II small subunit
MEQLTKREVIGFFFRKGILVSSDFFDDLGRDDKNKIYDLINEKIKSDIFLILNKDIADLLNKSDEFMINWLDLEKSRADFEKGKNKEVYAKFLHYLETPRIPKEETTQEKSRVKVVFSYEEDSKERDIQDFVHHLNSRYQTMERLLRQRQEMQNIMSISRIANKKDREHVSLVGMVIDKQRTKNNNLIFMLEDHSGFIKVLVNKNKPELFNLANDIVLDETIGVVGVNGDKIVFANNIVWPEIPVQRELKKSSDEVYALFLSDLHVGSNNFLEEDFNKFIKWVNMGLGNEKQKRIAEKVKYIFIAGDLIDGCGVYPGQEEELVIKDVKEQYDKCADLLKQIPNHINLIICPGNHDAVRIEEPQPALYKDFAKSIYELPNVTSVSNPSLVNIQSSEDFPGFDVLMYHGFSFDYFIANVDGLRNKGGYDRADIVMKFLLKRRHLAPSHESNLHIPDINKDPLVVGRVPDFLITGHIHKSIAANYRNITLVCGSCWQSKTAFQEKVGHNPEPSRVPIVNLKTRDIKILRF